MADPCVVYCDESQNDGPNYLNKSQPFYVIAGWVVPDTAIVAASVEMESLRQKYCKDSPELSFGVFKRRPQIICKSMERLGALGLVPLYVVAEKKYCIAGKIVETFLDPFYNPRVALAFTGDIPTKQEIANTLYTKLSESSLARFAKAYRTPTKPEMERALTEVVAECRRVVNPELAELIEGSIPKLAEIAESEVEAVSSWGKAMGTLNLPCLISFLMLIEELGRKDCLRAKKIVHDEQGPYQEDYRRAFREHREADEQRIQINGMRVPYGAIRMIDEFEVQSSKTQPLVQAADLLAGSIAHLAKALIAGQTLHEQEIELARLVLPPLLFHEVVIAAPVCSDLMLSKFGSAIKLAFSSEDFGTAKDANAGDAIRWTSTLPGTGPLPLVPPKPSEDRQGSNPHLSAKIDLPLFAISGVEDDQLVVILPSEKSYEETSGLERCVPVWTRRESAESLLREQEWDRPQRVVEFGVKEVADLVARLRAAAQWTDFVLFEMLEENEVPLPIRKFADDLERVVERVVRAAVSGFLPSLFRPETINGFQIGSLLLSRGTYAAKQLPEGPIAEGATREEAVANLMSILGSS